MRSYAAKDLEVIDANPVANVTPPKVDGRDPVILTDDQLEALLRECEGNDMRALYVLMLAETGARCESEALWLRWEDLDLDEGFFGSRVAATGTGRRAGGAAGSR